MQLSSFADQTRPYTNIWGRMLTEGASKRNRKEENIYTVFQEHFGCGFTRSSKLSLSRPVIAENYVQ